MTPAINYNVHWHKSCSNTSLVSMDYTTRTHTQMRKSPRKREREWERNEERDRKKKVKKIKKITK